MGRKLARRRALSALPCPRTEARFEAGRCQSHMRVEGRPDFECLRVTREVPQPHEAPFSPHGFGHRKFVAADMKGRALSAIGRLDLDQPAASIDLEAGNVISGAVTIQFRYASDIARQVWPAGFGQDCALMLYDAFLARTTQCSVARATERPPTAPCWPRRSQSEWACASGLRPIFSLSRA